MGRTIGLCNAIKSRHGPATGVAKMKRAAKKKRRRKKKWVEIRLNGYLKWYLLKLEKCYKRYVKKLDDLFQQN